MNHLIQLLLFFLLSFAIAGCRKEPEPVDHPVTVKLFPSDISYRTSGCFQLEDSNYVLYGYDAAIINQPPLMIKTDPAGNIIWKKKLSNRFHYLRAKAVSGGNILVVGVEGNVAAGINVCMLTPDSNTLFSNFYPIDDSVRGRQQYLPDLVEGKDGGFTILGHITHNDLSVPFILEIDVFGKQLKYRMFDSIAGLDLRTAAIARNKDGYSITGGALHPNLPRGIFIIRLNEQYQVMYDTILYDESGNISVEGIIEDVTDNSNIICGSYDGEDFTGILYVRRINEEGEPEPMQTFPPDYDNYGKFGSISRTQDGGYILAATVDQILGFNLVSSEKIYLLRLNEKLGFEWSRQFISENPLIGVSVIQTTDGGYLAGGHEITSSYVITMLMIKTDGEGNIVEDF